ncbi:hypothetical protein M408DRAFT_229043 [Serendipita vermifera MAFF 305830]|uniref:RING-type domain-containing protein n=1 Tax=Serendipita vermifera MAFF 305830 TaxID=933852 RepID=A0A0C2WE98_SERVB|nr:hypothetical protein M408DRAFT_229043 [Serendipita vermifera MAFF 305830]
MDYNHPVTDVPFSLTGIGYTQAAAGEPLQVISDPCDHDMTTSEEKMKQLEEERSSNRSIIEFLLNDLLEQAQRLEAQSRNYEQLHDFALQMLQMVRDIASECQCSICYECMIEPRMYPCGHVYCAQCCRSYTCPQCRTIARGPLPLPYALKAIAGRLKSENPSLGWNGDEPNLPDPSMAR